MLTVLQSFSAVVGPNGSGKSNVIDSLLFVFGFRASKLRQSKVASLIHTSDAHPNLTYCSVQVHFQAVVDYPTRESEVVPQSELVVSRKAFRNNSSKYYINGVESGYKEITTLLRAKGIDVDHKRFLILQGEVESIAQMKPKAEMDGDDGLLEYLEDIIGTSGYKAALNESVSKLEELNEECASKSSRVDLVKNEINKLESKKNETLRVLRAENRLASKKFVYYQLKIGNLEDIIETNSSALKEQQEKLESQQASTVGYQEEMTNLEESLKSTTAELANLKKQLSSRTKVLAKSEIAKVQAEEKSKHGSTKRKKLEKTISTTTHQINESKSWISNYTDETNELNAKLSNLEVKLTEKTKELTEVQNSLKGKTEGITNQIQAAEVKLEPWRQKIQQKESEIAVVQSQIDLIVEKQIASKDALKGEKARIEEIVAAGQTKEKAVEKMQAELKYVSEQIELGHSDCEHASVSLSEMKDNLNSIRQKVSTARDQFRATKSQGAVLTSLMDLSAAGKLDGDFYGRLGSLGSIDPMYDVAISTACPNLDNLVVQTVETGQQCVQYLRKNNLGWAKFILLDKLRDYEEAMHSPRDHPPEGVPRLFDLIKVKDQRLLPAFYSVLGDTVVAENADQARRIAYSNRRWRVVTLQGMLIDKSGTMSGGGRVLRGKMASEITGSVSSTELDTLEQELRDAESKYSLAESTFYKMQRQLTELVDRKPRIELDLSKLSMEIDAMSGQLDDAQKQYKEHSHEVKATAVVREQELKQVIEQQDQLKAQLQELQGHTTDLEAEIQKLQNQIMDIGGVQLRFIKSEVDSINSQREILNSRLQQGIMDNLKHEAAVKKHERVLHSAEEELKAIEEMSENSKQELRERILVIDTLQKEIDGLTTAVEETDEALDGLKTQQAEKRGSMNKLMSSEIEINNLIEQFQSLLSESTHKLKSYLAKKQELRLNNIEQMAAELRLEEKACSNTNDEEEEELDTLEDDTQYIQLVDYSKDELKDFNEQSLKQEMARLSDFLNTHADADTQVIEDYKRRLTEHHTRYSELTVSISARDKMRDFYETIRRKRLDEFMAGFNRISMTLKDMYQMLTMGGNAELELVDSLDPFSEGILFSVMPPKKSWKAITNLSGGEKTLSSLALVFALHDFKPTPLYVMDEIDAALDFRNVSIIANYIRERTRNGQFIVISLRNDMFELANQLVGIYKVNNGTWSIALQNRDYLNAARPSSPVGL